MYKPMLLHTAHEPFADDGWLWQLKWDGIRCIAVRSGGPVRLFTRHQRDITAQFPEVAAELDGQLACNAVLDGELICLSGGKPDFYRVLRRQGLTAADRIGLAAAREPAVLMLFDAMALDGRQLVHRPIEERQIALQKAVSPGHCIALAESFPGDQGPALAEVVKQHDLEGIVAKRRGSRYRFDHRSQDWLKWKVWRRATLPILGIRHDKPGVLVSLPGQSPVSVELGWRPVDRRFLRQMTPLLAERRTGDITWIKPLVEARIRYRLTPGGQLREPVFDGFAVARSAQEPAGS